MKLRVILEPSDEGGYTALVVSSSSPEIPAANGQGKTKDEARESLAEAIALILEDRREAQCPPEATPQAR